MKKILFCLIFLPALAMTQISNNMTLLSNLDLPNLPSQYGCEYGDIWGYTAPNGTEVAIVATIEQILFVNITAPANPVIILAYTVTNAGTSTTSQSLWRDFDTYQHFIYAVSDLQTAGLLIFDMSNVPTSISMVYQSNSVFSRAHTLFIDQLNGKLYAAGSNTQNNGLKILDLSANPISPTLFASVPLNAVGGGYVHDVYVRDNIAYCSHGSLSKIQIYDFNNLPTSFTVVGAIENYPEPGYNHSSWINDGGNTLIFTDETFGSDVKIVDISDPANISIGDIHTFYSELLGAGVPGASCAHNPYIIGNLAYISYYEDGVQVFDITDPASVTSFAYYDTYPSNTQYNDYIGCWGVYPFFASGHIIASDMNNGLFVMEITNNTLGLEFLSFDATRQKKDARLAWTVSNVTDGNLFEVQRSSDGGKTYTSVGDVTYNEHQSQYTFTDKNIPGQDKLFYRIDFVQLDGKTVHSPARSISPEHTEQIISVANPIASTLSLNILKPIESLDLNIYDMDGKLVWSHKESGVAGRMDLPVAHLIPAQYVLTLNWPGGTENLLIQIIK
ncbi:MAG: choice-of-anchor B family protein [Saprospiraceae bacterium]|uniref:Choice-of-anchor B family protein n=1 Tax=Candidatus Opimibacter skivensis TaxID=2982028 RepID=A0A9D7SWD6_9BACT|nr:choice-of-anchor B family protein [Candidatus Opimibacter skivensis]